MKKMLITLALGAALVAAPRIAAAGVDGSIGLGIPVPGVIFGPPPIVVGPPVVYAPAPPVYYGRPAYYGRVYGGRAYYGGRPGKHWRRHHWKRHHWND